MKTHNEREEYLMNQARMTAKEYMINSIVDIDQLFGKGYAKNNPVLVSAYMKTASNDFMTGMLSDQIRDLSNNVENLSNSTQNISETIFIQLTKLMDHLEYGDK